MAGFSVMSWYNLQVERKRSHAREQQYIAALMSRHNEDFVDSVKQLEQTPEQKVKVLQAENEIAKSLEKAEQQQKLGIPIMS